MSLVSPKDFAEMTANDHADMAYIDLKMRAIYDSIGNAIHEAVMNRHDHLQLSLKTTELSQSYVTQLTRRGIAVSYCTDKWFADGRILLTLDLSSVNPR